MSERDRRPAIVAVDDEPAVLAAVARDLRRAFAERYRILRAPSGAEALDILRQMRTRGDQVALLVADRRMRGTEYLVEAQDRPRRQACCSPPTPTPKPRSPRLTRSRSTTTCSSRGTRPRSSCTPSSRTS